MNIKGVGNTSPLLDLKKVERSVKTDQSHQDRDANGRQERGEDLPKRQLSAEQLEEAIKKLKEHPGIMSNHLNVRLVDSDGAKVVWVEDFQGKVIRRIPEVELWYFVQEKTENKGSIFEKAG